MKCVVLQVMDILRLGGNCFFSLGIFVCIFLIMFSGLVLGVFLMLMQIEGILLNELIVLQLVVFSLICVILFISIWWLLLVFIGMVVKVWGDLRLVEVLMLVIINWFFILLVVVRKLYCCIVWLIFLVVMLNVVIFIGFSYRCMVNIWLLRIFVLVILGRVVSLGWIICDRQLVICGLFICLLQKLMYISVEVFVVFFCSIGFLVFGGSWFFILLDLVSSLVIR